LAIPQRIGVILAAGRGSRMGQTKQLVLLQTSEGPKPLVAAAYDAIRPICDDMVVVVGHEADVVAAALRERAVHRVESDPAKPMFESIRAGLRAALTLDENATIVLQPGDQPEVSTETLRTLIDWSLQRPERAIIPQIGARGGHPAVIPSQIARLLAQADCPQGLGEYWLLHPELCVRVPVNDPAALWDIDVPSDLP
jgi:molybdenum cofactor cytidylyltransferase